MGRLSERLSPSARRTPETAARGAGGAGVRAAVFLTLAVLAALGAALLFSRYLDRRALAARVPTEKVVVAAVDLPVATTLRAELLTVVDWPKSSLPEGSARDAATLAGKVLRNRLLKGEPILAARLASGDAGQGLAAILPANMRAVSVRVDDVVGVAGFVHPGDRVDVIVTMKAQETANVPATSKVILQNVQVLAVGKELDRKGKQLDKAVPVTVATLMVTTADSEKLALASTKGQILLALRSGVDTEEVETSGVVPAQLLGGEASAGPAEKPPPPAASTAAARPALARKPARSQPAHAAPKQGQEIEILRGDLFEKREFATPEAKP